MSDEYTQIRIKKTPTRVELNSIGMKEETYDELIMRLVQFYKKRGGIGE